MLKELLSKLALDRENEINPWKSVKELSGILMSDEKLRGFLGIAGDEPKGTPERREEFEQTIKRFNTFLSDFIKKNKDAIEEAYFTEATARITGKHEEMRSATNFSTEHIDAITKELNRIFSTDYFKDIHADFMESMKNTKLALSQDLSKIQIQNVRESSREGTADQAESDMNKTMSGTLKTSLDVVSKDADDGLNSEANTQQLFTELSALGDMFVVLSQVRDLLATLLQYGPKKSSIGAGGSRGARKSTSKGENGLPSTWVKDSVTGLFKQTSVKDLTDQTKRRIKLPKNSEVDQLTKKQNYKRAVEGVEQERAQIEKGEHPSQQRRFLEQSTVSTYNASFFGKLEKAIKDALPKSEVDRIMNANKEQQEVMRAERIEKYGLNRGRQLTDTGDIADVKRTKSLFGWEYNRDKKNKNLFQDVTLTPGFTGESAINTKSIMESLNKVLSGPEMFKAQTGGTFRNILGSMTGYVGMPSLEKSRAAAEGLNQVMANVRTEILGLIQDIQSKESTLSGMEKMGTAKFTKDGKMTADSSLAAQNTFAKLEEQKGVLSSALAEVKALDAVIDKSGGKISKIVKNIGFVMPELMQNNTILHNINAGLDKNGKALKFQSRTAEVLNYSFQLMARHIGQMIKNWLMMMNPITWLKRAFQDFAGWDPKLQRTFKVIHYNLRDVIRPMMEWISQQIVNVIGFLDIISMKIQAAFGNTPISLFDQENADKVKKTYEDMNEISAGFDELHDIGSAASENNPDNLLGEIYKPKLSQDWIDLANEIGDLFAGVIKGDLGFGEAMAKILQIAWHGLKILGGYVWDFFKNHIWPAVKDNVMEILAWTLGAFLGWKLLKIAGKVLWNALLGKFTAKNITGVFGKVGGWITKALGATSFGSGILQGLSNMLVNGGGLAKTLKYAFTYPGLITQMGGWGEMLGMIIGQSLVVALGLVIAGFSLVKGFDAVADRASYNQGLMANGGREEDKKGYAGVTALTTLGAAGGGALAGLAIGGPIGAAIGAGIGAIAGLITTSLAPAFEKLEVSARNANNEMQKIEYYEGAVQGCKSEVDELDQLMTLSNQTLQSQTDKVYALGDQYGINKERLDYLIQSIKDGTYNTGLLTENESVLSSSLDQLSWAYTNNEEQTKKLTEAKKRLQKAELELSIMQDIAAGNFEIAAARVEVAYASNVYTADEATKKMVQIAKEGSEEQASALLKDMSPDLQAKFQKEYGVAEGSINELLKMYYGYSEDERKYFLQNLTGDVQRNMQARIDAISREVENAPWYKRLFDWNKDGKIFGHSYVDVPGYATGTNYVPSDGLAYLHKGEAVIPKKYNEGISSQGAAYQQNTAASQELFRAVGRLEQLLSNGIEVNGQFVQRGSDLVAVVNKTRAQSGADLLSNVAYAR